jgi:Tol biopolymer transport system component
LPAGRLSYGRFDSSGVTPFTSNTDGTDERQLLPPSAEGPSWSPNGLVIAVALESPQGLLFSGTVNPDGSDFVRFDSPDSSLNLGCTVWSPDGTRLACEGWDDTDTTRNGIYTVRSTDGGDLVRVTESPAEHHDIPGDYSLDGNQIIFSRSLPEPLAIDGDDSHLMIVNLDGSDEQRLSDQLMGGGRLSPDGTTILTTSGNYLTLVPVGGGQAIPIHIADAPNDLALGGAWSPDGQRIVFTLHPRSAAHSDIYIMLSDGTDLHQVTNTPNQDEEFADWAPVPQDPPPSDVIQLEYGCEPGLARCEHMPAGTYETSGQWAFLPGLTVTLPADWSSAEQDAGEFELSQASDADRVSEIYFWSDVVPFADGRVRPDLGRSADELAEFLLGDDRLTVSEGPTRTFGVRGPDDSNPGSSVKARSFSVVVSDSAPNEPELSPDCPAEACINLLTDTDHWSGQFELLRDMPAEFPNCPCSQAVRFYIADIGSDQDPHTLVIALSTFGLDALESLSDWETQVEPIIATVLVPYVVVNN